MTIRIKNLRLRTVVGIKDWERTSPQDVIINVTIDFDGGKVIQSDHIQDTVDYKNVKRRIMGLVEKSDFFLLEKLAYHVLETVMQDKMIRSATVEVDKSHALRFADSVSVSCAGTRGTDGSWAYQ